MLVELRDVVNYLEDLPKEFEIGDLEKVIESDGRKYSRMELVKTLNRLPKHVKLLERERTQENYKQHKNTKWIKLGGC
jgi:inorganic pyrophosphatase